MAMSEAKRQQIVEMCKVHKSLDLDLELRRQEALEQLRDDHPDWIEGWLQTEMRKWGRKHDPKHDPEQEEEAGPAWEPGPEVEPTKAPMSMLDFMCVKFPPREFLVPGIIAERMIGVTAGRPQVGKTPLVMQWALSVARGEPWTKGMEPSKKAGVLWLGLERGPEVLQQQLRELLGKGVPPDNFYVQWEWPRLGLGAERLIEDFLKEHPDVGLVCIDTWGQAKPKKTRQGGMLAYDDDYADVQHLRNIVKAHLVAIELITHQNQSKDTLDMLASIYGGTGFVGAVDVRRLLTKGKNDRGQLQVGGTLVKPEAQRLTFVYPKWQPIDTIEAMEEMQAEAEKAMQTAFEALRKFGPAGATYGDWLHDTGLPESSFNRHRKILIDKGYASMSEGKGRKLYHAVVSGSLSDLLAGEDEGEKA